MTHLNITFPEELKAELDEQVKKEHTKRSTLIQTAVRVYLGLKKKDELTQKMKEGYLAMNQSDRLLNKDWEISLLDGFND